MQAHRLYRNLFDLSIIDMLLAITGPILHYPKTGILNASSAPVMHKSHFSLSNPIWGDPHLSTIHIALSVIVSGFFVALKGSMIRIRGQIHDLSHSKQYWDEPVPDCTGSRGGKCPLPLITNINT